MTDRTKSPTATAAAHAPYFVDTTTALRAEDELRRAAEALARQNTRYAAAALQHRAGRAAEIWHAATLQHDATLKGVPLHARTTASIGLPHAKADIIVEVLGSSAPVSAQVKYASTAAKSAIGQARAEYAGMQRVVPADQVAEAQRIAASLATRLSAGADPRAPRVADAATHMSDRVRVQSASSAPLTRHDALELARDPSALARHGQFARLAHAAQGGAVSGALSGGAVAVLTHGTSMVSGRIGAGEAALGLAKDTVAGALRGGVTAAGSQAIASAAAREGLRTFARSSAPLAIATTAVDASLSLASCASGRISASDCRVQIRRTVAAGAGSWAGMELGAAIGTAVLPGVGTVLGGLLGGVAGSMGVDLLFRR